MNEIFGIKGVEIGNVYNFACEDMVSKPTVVELEQGGLLGGLADWAVNPSNCEVVPRTFIIFRFVGLSERQVFVLRDENEASSVLIRQSISIARFMVVSLPLASPAKLRISVR